MESGRQELVVNTSEFGWSRQDSAHEELDELRAFGGICFAVVSGLGIWAVIFLLIRII